MPRTISFLGSVALLVSNITGPSLVIIPLLYQQAGWLTPILTFVTIAVLSGAAALFIVEAMSSLEGNEEFQADVEFTTIAEIFLGKKWHILVQVLLYFSMQSLVVASLLEAFQSMNAFLLDIAHKTCAISFTEGWVCRTCYFPMHDANSVQVDDKLLPDVPKVFSGYILCSVGTLITLCLILPLSLVRLVDNIMFQIASFIVLLVITLTWVVIFCVKGLDVGTVPVIGHDHSNVVGFIISNFTFVMTIPAWVNNTHPSVNIRLAVWTSILVSCVIYIPIGWMGGLAFIYPDNGTLLEVLGTSTGHGALKTVAKVSSSAFPLSVLIASIPVFTIVIRYNLLRGNMCSKRMAIFLSAIVPWLIVIPLQTNNSLTRILDWASLIVTSPCNLLFPFILFIVSKRHPASVSGANVPGDPEMSFAPADLTTPPRGCDIREETIPVNRVDTDSTAVYHPDDAEREKTNMGGTDKCEVGAKSISDAVQITVVSRMSLSSRRGGHEQGAQGEAGGALTGTRDMSGPGPYLAFPMLSPPSRIRSTHISAVGGAVAAALVLTALVYNMVQAAGGKK